MHFKKTLLASSVAAAVALSSTAVNAQFIVGTGGTSSTNVQDVSLPGASANGLIVQSTGTIITADGGNSSNAINVTGQVTGDIVIETLGVVDASTTTATAGKGINIALGEVVEIDNAGAINAYDEGIYMGDGAHVAGDIMNSGVISADVNGGGSAGIRLNQDFGGPAPDPATTFPEVTGSLINSGTIQSAGGAGVEVTDGVIKGTVTIAIQNTGAASIIRGNTHGIAVSAQDLGVGTVNGISNDGLIEGTTLDGITIDNGATLTGGITNTSGAVIVGGVSGVAVGSATFSGGITNNGGIIGSADAAIVIDQNAVFSGGIDNQVNGRIGGIATEDATFSGGINNDGLIESTINDLGAIDLFGDFNGDITNGATGIVQNHTTPGAEPAPAIWLGSATVDGDINNANLIDSMFSSSIYIQGYQAAPGNSAIFAPTVLTGAIANTGDIQGGTFGIDIRGATVGGITNATGATISGADGGINITSAQVQVDGQDNDVGFIDTSVVSVAGDINNSGDILSTSGDAITIINGIVQGDIINSGTMNGTTGGILVFGSGASVGDIVNSGLIVSSSTSDDYGIDIQNSSAGTIINNANGTIRGFAGGLIVEDATVGGITNNAGGTIEGVSGDAIVVRGLSAQVGSGIVNAGTLTGAGGVVVEGGASLNSVNNSGTITGSAVGIIADGSSIASISNSGTINGGTLGAIRASNGGSIAVVDNTGTINGSVDFGTMGGAYFVAGGSSGSVIGATDIGIFMNGPGVTTSTINGDLTYNGRLVVEAGGSAAGINDYSRLLVTGDANVTGASVFVTVSSGFDLFSNGSNFNFLSANGTLTSDITTASGCDVEANPECLGSLLGGIAIADTSQVLDFNVIQQGNNLLAVIGNIDFAPPLPPELEGSAGADNLNSVAGALTAAILDPSNDLSGTELGDVANALTAIDTSTSAGQAAYAKALGSLDPDTIEGSATGSLQADSSAATTVDNRTAALREGAGLYGAVASGDDPFSLNGVWVQVYDNETDQGTRDGVDGFDADTYGFAVGVDAPVGERMNVGLAFSYADTEVDSKIQSDNKMAIDSFRLAGYGSYNADTYYLDAQVAYGMNDYQTDRVIDATLTSDQLIATGDHDGDQFSLRLRGGYPMAFESGWYVTPKLEMDYTYLKEDSYTEKNAGNVGLIVDTDDVEVLVFGVGVKAAYPIVTDSDVTWIPELSFDYMYDVVGDEVEIDSNFIGVSGAAFITNGATVEQEMYKVSLRLRAFGAGNFSFSGGYDYVGKQDYDSESLMLTMRYDF